MISKNSKHDSYGASVIKKMLRDEKDFNCCLEKIVSFLKGYEPFRLERKNSDSSVCKDILSISEILVLKVYHRSIWGA